MTTQLKDLANYNSREILCHCLWEMTFYGYDEDTINGHKEELDRRYEEMKSGKEDLYEMVKNDDGEIDFVKVPDEEHPYRNKE